MRILGIALTALGALALGHRGLVYATREEGAAGPVAEKRGKEKGAGIPPVAAGIVTVTGLIVIATTGKRDSA